MESVESHLKTLFRNIVQNRVSSEYFIKKASEINKIVEEQTSAQVDTKVIISPASFRGYQNCDHEYLPIKVLVNLDLHIQNVSIEFRKCTIMSDINLIFNCCKKITFSDCEFSKPIELKNKDIVDLIDFNKCTFTDDSRSELILKEIRAKRISITDFIFLESIEITDIENCDDLSISQIDSQISVNLRNIKNLKSISLGICRNSNSRLLLNRIACRSLTIDGLASIKNTVINPASVQFENIELMHCQGISLNGAILKKKCIKSINSASEIDRIVITECSMVSMEDYTCNTLQIKKSHDVTSHRINTIDEMAIIDQCSGIKIKNCSVNFLAIDSFNDSSNLNYLWVTNSNFKQAPWLNQSSIPNDNIFQGNTFDDTSESAIFRYRNLKKMLLEKGNEKDAMTFSSLEMLSTFQSIKWNGNIAEKLVGHIANIFNKFGLNLFQPIIVLLGFSIIFASLFCLMENIELNINKESPMWVQNISQWYYFFKMLVFSILNSLGPASALANKGHFSATSIWSLMFVFTQQVASTVLLYLFAMGVKRKYRIS